ncbi:MAG: SDR family oxidoreductase [Proteobacteria bacterium]|nr:SDR family oxidoreductase [Pseudomonadota bacterium]
MCQSSPPTRVSRVTQAQVSGRTGKPAAPSQIAHAVAFFADPKTEFVTGQILYADGGVSLGAVAL